MFYANPDRYLTFPMNGTAQMGPGMMYPRYLYMEGWTLVRQKGKKILSTL